MKMIVNQIYTAVGCNRTPEIVDWNKEGLICFGATNAVVIYDNNEKCKDPITVLSHHRSIVNAVRWVYKPDGSCTELVSCSADKTAAIWTLVNRTWKVTSILTGHTDGITCVHGIYHGDKLLIYTGSIDCTVNVWERSNDTTLKHTIQLHNSLCLTLRAHIMPSANKPILFCALDDHKIHVFSGDDYHRVHSMWGHEDWVRGLDVLEINSTTILLASASQDSYIRLWRINPHLESEPTGLIAVEQKLFTAFEQQWSVKLEAVVGGHEGWVYGIQWHWSTIEKGKHIPVYRLLSSSLDKTIIIWEPDPTTGIWTEQVRLGEVGGNGLGFYGSRFGPEGQVLGHGYNGSFHVWTHCEKSNEWKPAVVCGGHFGAVEDVRWEPHKGRFLASVSADQTTRIHTPWRRPDGLEEWHELARPQVHGYDMASLALVSSCMFASAAEEKVIRVFTAPNNFHHNFENITGQVLVEGGTKGPEGASVPSLGLSNKAVFGGHYNTLRDDGNGDDQYFVPINMTEPPTEENLMQNTLWPEHQKLYGHGYEVFVLAASPDHMLLASSCKATDQEHAALLLWETKSWSQIQKLVYHQLTITQVEFSLDSLRLLTVSRDRRWCLFRRREDSLLFDKVACTDKTNGVHSRIIWCCAWAPDGIYFGTGSRDGKVCVWSETDTAPAPPESSLGAYALHGKALELSKSSVTALAFAPILHAGARIIAVGLESGVVRLYAFDGLWTLLHDLDNSAAHHLAVKRLAFKPQQQDATNMQAVLASAGGDHLVRLHSVSLL